MLRKNSTGGVGRGQGKVEAVSCDGKELSEEKTKEESQAGELEGSPPHNT